MYHNNPRSAPRHLVPALCSSYNTSHCKVQGVLGIAVTQPQVDVLILYEYEWYYSVDLSSGIINIYISLYIELEKEKDYTHFYVDGGKFAPKISLRTMSIQDLPEHGRLQNFKLFLWK